MRNKGLLTALLVITLVGNVFGQWNRYAVGINSICKIDVSSNNQSILLKQDSNLWLSTNYGATWDRIHDITDDGEWNVVDTQVLDENSYILNLVLDYTRIFRTDNAGDSWDELNFNDVLADYPINESNNRLFRIDERLENRWFYIEGDGIAVSNDSGSSWDAYWSPQNWYLTTKVWTDVSNPDEIYLLGQTDHNSSRGLILYSGNSGSDWEILLTPSMVDETLLWAHDMTILEDGTLLTVVGDENGIPKLYKSNDTVTNWEFITNFSPLFHTRPEFFRNDNYPGSLFYHDGETILESTDNGLTWNENRLGIPQSGNEISALCVNRTDNSILMNLDDEGLIHSVSDEEWTYVNTPSVNSCINIFQRNTEFYSDGIFCYDGGGSAWFKANDSDRFTRHRYQEDPDSTISLNSHLYRDNNRVIFFGYKKSKENNGSRRYLFISEDSGASFEKRYIDQNLHGQDYYLFEVKSVVDGEEVILKAFYAGIGDNSENTLIRTSLDLGETWSENIWEFVLYPYQMGVDGGKFATEVFGSGSNFSENIRLSYDGGTIWFNPGLPDAFPNGRYYNFPVWHDDEVFYVIDGRLFSYNPTSQWNQYSIVNANEQWERFCMDVIPTDHYTFSFVGAYRGSTGYLRTDEGASIWYPENHILDWEETGTMIYGVRYDEFRDLVWFSTSNGLFSVEANALSADEIIADVPVEYELLEAYPNPFNPSTQINYTIKQGGVVQLKVFDVLGREVSSLVEKNMTPGRYTTSFNGSNLSSGTYFLNLETPSNTISQKITLVK